MIFICLLLIFTILLFIFIKSYSDEKSDKKLVFSILRNLPTTSNKIYTSENKNDKLSLFTNGNKLVELNLITRELVYDLKLSDEHNIRVSLNQREFEKVRSSLSFITDTNKEVTNCFQELIDYDYIVSIVDCNFLDKTFHISVKNKYEELVDINTLFSCIERLELMYNVSLTDGNSDGYIIKKDSNYLGSFLNISGNIDKKEITNHYLSISDYKTLKMYFVSK